MPPHWLVYIFGVADQNMRWCMVEFYKCDDYVCCRYFGAKNCISPDWWQTSWPTTWHYHPKLEIWVLQYHIIAD